MNGISKNAIFVALACVAALFRVGDMHAAHPLHTTQTEIRVNPTTGSLEVTMCVFACDLEDAIGRQSGDAFDLVDCDSRKQPNEANAVRTKEADQAIEAYVRSCFAISIDNAIEPASLRWVGFELERQRVWIYLEIKDAAAASIWGVQNEMFRELNEDQANRVTVLDGSRSNSLECEPGRFVRCRRKRPIRFPSSAAADQSGRTMTPAIAP